MVQSQSAQASIPAYAEHYNRDGYVVPIDVVSAGEAQALRNDLEAAEAELADDPEKLALLRGYPDRLLPSFDALTRNETLITAASSILGPNLIVASGSDLLGFG